MRRSVQPDAICAPPVTFAADFVAFFGAFAICFFIVLSPVDVPSIGTCWAKKEKANASRIRRLTA
jgi:hypothetical protein